MFFDTTVTASFQSASRVLVNIAEKKQKMIYLDIKDYVWSEMFCRGEKKIKQYGLYRL